MLSPLPRCSSEALFGRKCPRSLSLLPFFPLSSTKREVADYRSEGSNASDCTRAGKSSRRRGRKKFLKHCFQTTGLNRSPAATLHSNFFGKCREKRGLSPASGASKASKVFFTRLPHVGCGPSPWEAELGFCKVQKREQTWSDCHLQGVVAGKTLQNKKTHIKSLPNRNQNPYQTEVA